MRGMLLLFDVDGTLVTTAGVGISAMDRAGKAFFGDTFDAGAVQYAGRLDPLIIADLLVAHDKPVHEEAIEAFRGGYRDNLIDLLEESDKGRPCPGILELIDVLEAREDVTLGLLTGNYQETGTIKLRACGIEPDRFPVHVWGNDSPDDPPCRTKLPPVGMERYEAAHGQPPRETVIIGDTPHDITCAAAHGCRSLAVATGMFSVDELHAAGATLAVADLSDTQRIVEWFVSGEGTA